MAKKTTGKDEVLGTINKELIEAKAHASALKAEIGVLEGAISILIETAKKIKGGILGSQTKTAEGIRNVNKLMGDANSVAKSKIEIDKKLKKARLEEIKIQQNREKAIDNFTKKEKQAATRTEQFAKKAIKVKESERLAEIRLQKAREQAFDKFEAKLIKEQAAKEKITASTKKQQEAERKLIAEMKREKGTLEKIEISSKELRLERTRLNLGTKKGRLELKRINRQLDINNATIERNSDKMKKQRLGVGRYKTAINGLRGALAKLGIAFGGIALARNAFNVIKDFQQASADLKSVLATATQPQIESLIKQSKELGAVTRFTAAQVSQLQLEYAKLGFDPSEIENMTEATLSLAAATNTELAEAASVTGGLMNAFGLDSAQTTHTVDVMAKSFSSSALDMEKFKETMKTAAPIARAAGISLEQATAAAGKLADANISGSKAGTDLKRIFSELVKDGKPLAESLEDIAEKMDKASSPAEKLALAEKLVGERAKGSLLILVEQREALGKLSEGLVQADGDAKRMADTQLNTLGGSLDLLKSAWEGLILSMDEAGGVGEKLRNGIKFLANNLGTIVKWIGRLIKVFIVYTVITSKAFKATKLFGQELIKANGNIKKASKSIGDMAKATKKNSDATKDGAKAAVSFKDALKSIGFALAIALAIELAMAFFDVATGADEARRQVERLKNANANAAQNVGKLTDKAKAHYDEQIRLLDLEIRKRIANGEKESDLAKERIESEKKIAKEGLKIITDTEKFKKDALNDTLKLEDLANKVRTEQAKGSFKSSKAAIKDQKKLARELRNIGFGGEVTSKRSAQIASFKDLDVTINKLVARNARLSAEVVGASKAQKEYNDLIDESIIQQDELSSGVGAFTPTKAVAKLNTELEQQNELLSRQLELLQELDQLDFAAEVRVVQLDIDEEIANASKLARETAELDVDIVEALVQKKFDILKKAALDRQAFEISTLIETRRIEKKIERDRLIDSRDKLLAQKGLTTAQKADIEAQYQEQLKELEMNELQRAADLELEIRLIKKRSNAELIELTKEQNEEVDQINNELIDAQIEGAEKKNEAAQEERDKDLEADKDLHNNKRDLIQKLTDFFISQSNKRIKKIDEEISASEKEFDFLSAKAAAGSIAANESLAAEKKNLEELRAAREEEEKKKQRIMLVSAVLQSYNAELAAGATTGEALSKAITSTTLLTQFVNALPGFFEGTENTGDQGAMKDQRGVITGYTHKNERVIDEKKNNRIGHFSNEELTQLAEKELTQLAENKRLGRYNYDSLTYRTYSDDRLVNKMDGVTDGLKTVTKAIEDKEVQILELGEISQGLMAINDHRIKGNKRTTNTFLVEKNG